jgi:diadenylate cyclase
LGDYLPFGLRDLLDVGVVAAVLFVLLVGLRRARARLAVFGVGIAGGIYLLARLLGLELTAWIFQGFFAVLIVILVVVFQEDLRRLFERIAIWGLRRRTPPPGPAIVDVLVRSAARLAEKRSGALFVLPGREPLERHVEGGIALNGVASEPLLLSLFDTNSPGHDGAAIIGGDRVIRFAVHLPLSANQLELGAGGTRHAAALGLSERVDALCIVVSEERGTISVARDGHLRTLAQPAELTGELRAFQALLAPASPTRTARWRGAARHAPEAGAALALAAALWIVRVPGAAMDEVVRSVPVIVDKLPEGYELESVDPREVQVTLSGLRRDLFLRAGQPVEVHVDALLAKLGRRTFRIGPDQVATPPRIDVVAVQPDEVRLSVRAGGASEAGGH